MNEFELHEKLLVMEAVASQYPQGQSCLPEIRNTLTRLSTQHYRVAVIGEFNRGKSSLVNAIIGAQVLPTDILPMTAAITRVTYGDTRSIRIHFHDGSSEEKTVDQLLEYATKYDAQREKQAAAVREIVVTYPSVFCRNRIDIIDTPGLNDNELMTDVTLSILGQVDAAIVVVSAMHPLSLTEKQLIVDLLAKKHIRHLIFAVTHIDAVSPRASEQDRMIDFIRERLRQDVLQMAMERFREDAYFQDKASRILAAPDLFGVSSVLAIDGFIQDNWELLEESRFPYFKNELLALLTAAQHTDIADSTGELFARISAALPAWHADALAALERQKAATEGMLQRLNGHRAQGIELLNRLFTQLDAALTEHALMPCCTDHALETELRMCFIRQLSSIRTDNFSDFEIARVLRNAKDQADRTMAQYSAHTAACIREHICRITEVYGEERLACGYSGTEFGRELSQWYARETPMLRWSCSPIPQSRDLTQLDLMPEITGIIARSVSAYEAALADYIAQWRLLLLRRNARDLEDRELADQLTARLQHIGQDIHLRTHTHTENLEKLRKISV